MMHLFNEIARLAKAKRAVRRSIVPGHQIVDRLGRWLESKGDRGGLEQPAELGFRRIDELDFVGYSPEEGLVDERSRLDVRREYDQLVEGNLNRAPAGQVDEVVPLLQRNDPAVQQLARRHPLAAKVVDHQCP